MQTKLNKQMRILLIYLPRVLLLLGEPLLLDAVRLPGLEPEVSPELRLCVVPSTA